MRIFLALFLCLYFNIIEAQTPFDNLISTDLPENINSVRGVHVVNDSVAWITGVNGFFGKTEDKGKNWTFGTISTKHATDYRSIYAFDKNTAIAVGIGSPGVIYKTNDGGIHWKLVYFNADTNMFLDGIKFQNNLQGVVVGDPIGGYVFILETFDQGENWIETPKTPAMVQEGAFAASNSSIGVYGNGGYVFGFGSPASTRILNYNNRKLNDHFHTYTVPFFKGEACGIYALDVKPNKGWVVAVGGSYLETEREDSCSYISFDFGQTFKPLPSHVGGYRSCVQFIPKTDYGILVASYKSMWISHNLGKQWTDLNIKDVFAFNYSPNGSWMVMVGKSGTVRSVHFSE